MFYGTLELWKGTKIYSVGKRILTVNYSLTKESRTYAANGLALVEFSKIFNDTPHYTGYQQQAKLVVGNRYNETFG